MARTLGHGHPVSSLIIRNPVSSQPVAALISHDSLSLSAQETPRATSSRRWTKRKKFKTWQRSGENSGQQTVSPLTLHDMCIQIMPSLSFNIGWNCDFLHFFGFHFGCKLGDFGGHERGGLNFLGGVLLNVLIWTFFRLGFQDTQASWTASNRQRLDRDCKKRRR